MVDRLVNSEANARRITLVESCFGSAGQPLSVPGRVLVGEGVLTKMCRKKPKPRQFYLFNDLLVYGNIIINKKKYNKQHIIPLEEVKLQSLEDEGQFRNGWLICTRGKSFAVYAATATEKQEWMAHINKCIKDLLEKSGKKPSNEHAAVWVPDSEAVICMVCKKSQFNVLNRRHHCRKCGAVVCGPCSTRRYLLPSQSSKPIRVCDPCFGQLSESTKPDTKPNNNTNITGPPPPAPPIRRDSYGNLSTVVEEEDNDVKSELGSVSLFSTTSVAQVSVSDVSTGVTNDVPPVLMPSRNPNLYQLVQMSGESSFWWDSTESSDPDRGGLVQNFSSVQPRISDVVVDESRGNDSSGEDDSDDEEQNGNEEQNASMPKTSFYASPVTTS